MSALSSISGIVTGPEGSSQLSAGSQFSVTLEQPPRVIGQTGELKEKAVKETLKWVAFNKAELLDVWEGVVDEKRAQFTTFDMIKVAASLQK